MAVVQLLGQAEDVLLVRDEAHLEVELSVLGLAVGAQVLVAEAAGDLEVALEAGHHQQLLELLRRLRQRVEVAGVDAAGDEVVARALRRRCGQKRRLDLGEAAVAEEVADELDDAVAGDDVLVHRLAAQVEVAVLQAQELVDVGLFVDVEGRRLGGVQDLRFGDADLDLAGGELGVLGALRAAGDGALRE